MTRQVLHVGCGRPNPAKLHRVFHGDQWKETRLDIDPAVTPDIVGDMRDLSALEARSLDAIWSSHNLEHLYTHEVVPTLEGFRRLLRPDGFALVTMPDLQEVARLVAEGKLEEPAYVSPAGPVAPIDILYGFRPSMARGNLFMAHRTGFTEKSLAKAFLKAGFATVATRRVRSALELWAIAFVCEPSQERLANARREMFPVSAPATAQQSVE